jgi:hypothetical protein
MTNSDCIWQLFKAGRLTCIDCIKYRMTRKEFERRWGAPVDWRNAAELHYSTLVKLQTRPRKRNKP